MQVDTNEAIRTAPEDLHDEEFYGRLEHILHLRMPPRTVAAFNSKIADMRETLIRRHAPVPDNLHQDVSSDHVLVSIRNARLSNEESGLESLDVHYATSLAGPLHVVDAISLQCLIGRVFDGNKWSFIDRSGGQARTSLAS